jgi:hypothetical protein
MLAMVRGFSREVLSIASWIAAAVCAFLFYKPVLPYLQPYIDNPQIAMAAAAGIVFLVALIVVTVITMKIADFIIDSRVGRARPGARLPLRGGPRHSRSCGRHAVLRLAGRQQSAGSGFRRARSRKPLLENIGRRLDRKFYPGKS